MQQISVLNLRQRRLDQPLRSSKEAYAQAERVMLASTKVREARMSGVFSKTGVSAKTVFFSKS